eukprot:TCONS_00022352-protein
MLRQKLNIPYSVEKTLVTGFILLPPSVRADQNSSLCEDLYKFIAQNQELRLRFNSTLEELKTYKKEDFSEGIKVLVRKFVPNVRETHRESSRRLATRARSWTHSRFALNSLL